MTAPKLTEATRTVLRGLIACGGSTLHPIYEKHLNQLLGAGFIECEQSPVGTCTTITSAGRAALKDSQ